MASTLTGRPRWIPVLQIGAAVEMLVGMLLLATDRSGFPPAVARDALIVAVAAIASAAVVALLTPSAEDSKVVRRVITGAVALVTALTMMGVVSQAVTPWTALPAIAMIVGLLLMYRDVTDAGARRGDAAR